MANEIDKIDGFTLKSDNFIREFVIQSSINANEIIVRAYENGFTLKSISDNEILIAVTEKRSDNEINDLIDFFKSL